MNREERRDYLSTFKSKIGKKKLLLQKNGIYKGNSSKNKINNHSLIRKNNDQI